MYYGLRNLPQSPQAVADSDVYSALLTIHKALQGIEFSQGAGWARYADAGRTAGAPQVVNSGVTATIVNDASSATITYLPANVTAFYVPAGNKFMVPAAGDLLQITVRFKLKPYTTNMHVDFALYLGGATGLTFKQSLPIAKGVGVENDLQLIETVYATPDFLANGAIPKITPIGGNIDIYAADFTVARIFSTGTVT